MSRVRISWSIAPGLAGSFALTAVSTNADDGAKAGSINTACGATVPILFNDFIPVNAMSHEP